MVCNLLLLFIIISVFALIRQVIIFELVLCFNAASILFCYGDFKINAVVIVQHSDWQHWHAEREISQTKQLKPVYCL